MTLALPAALYLIPERMDDYPLPRVLMSLVSHRFLTVGKQVPDGVQAIINPATPVSAFTPPLIQHWRWFGMNFEQEGTDVITSLGGYLFLQWGQFSTVLWERIERLHIQFWHFITRNFSWLAMLFAIGNLLIFTLYAYLRKRVRVRT